MCISLYIYIYIYIQRERERERERERDRERDHDKTGVSSRGSSPCPVSLSTSPVARNLAPKRLNRWALHGLHHLCDLISVCRPFVCRSRRTTNKQQLLQPTLIAQQKQYNYSRNDTPILTTTPSNIIQPFPFLHYSILYNDMIKYNMIYCSSSMGHRYQRDPNSQQTDVPTDISLV